MTEQNRAERLGTATASAAEAARQLASSVLMAADSLEAFGAAVLGIVGVSWDHSDNGVRRAWLVHAGHSVYLFRLTWDGLDLPIRHGLAAVYLDERL